MSKFELENFVMYGRLFEVYGKLLSEERQKILEAYLSYNMTLVEIAKEKQISRQAVLDAIKKSCDKLDEFENKLQIFKHKEKLFVQLKELEQFAPQIKEKVEKILKDL